jgi:CelD/BcsL family acetyltransferase involved in cellulose biosynthesis
MLHVTRISATDALLPLASDWNRLAADVPFRQFAWHNAWWRHYGGGPRELFVLVVREGGTGVSPVPSAETKLTMQRHGQDASATLGPIVGIAPWFVETTSSRGRVIAPLGSGEVCSDYQGVLALPADAEAVTEAIADWLTTTASDHTSHHAWDLLHLDNIAADDVAIGRLVSHIWTGGNTVHREPGANCWRITLSGDWEQYVESLSKSHRKQVRRLERCSLATGRAVLHTADSPKSLGRAMALLVELHQARWQSLGQPGCFSTKAFAGFLHEVAEEMSAAGKLRLHWIEIDGVPAAVEFQLAGGGVTYAYQAGVRPELLDEEPGRLINIATIRHAIEHGASGFDFLRGDEPYKAHFRAEPRETVTYRIVPQRTLAQVRHGLWLAGDSVKGWVKTGLELAGMR